MGNIWDRYESIASADEVATAKSKYAPLEAGDYECVLTKIAPAENKDGLPMIKGEFKILAGGRRIYYNQNLQNINNPDRTADNIYDATVFIGGLLGEEVVYTGMADLADKIMSIGTEVEYTINVSYGKKDVECKFPKLKVIPKVASIKDETPPFDI